MVYKLKRLHEVKLLKRNRPDHVAKLVFIVTRWLY